MLFKIAESEINLMVKHIYILIAKQNKKLVRYVLRLDLSRHFLRF